MTRRLLTLLLALLTTLTLAACGGGKTEQTPEQPRQETPAQRPEQPRVDPVSPLPGTQPLQPETPNQPFMPLHPHKLVDEPYTLPTLPEENRNIPEGSNVVQVGDKWIVAPNLDVDIYRDTTLYQMHLFVLSREPMDTESFSLKSDQKSEGPRLFANENTDQYRVEDRIHLGYHCVDWKEYARYERNWAERKKAQEKGEELPAMDLERWREFQDMLQNAPRYMPSDMYIYDLSFDFYEFQEEADIHSLTVSWPGAEQTVDIGEIRLRGENIYEQYGHPYDLGMDCSTGEMLGAIFGPDVACCALYGRTWEEQTITFRSVASLNESCQVEEVVVVCGDLESEDRRILTPDHPVTIDPEEAFQMYIYFTGPHLSELTAVCQTFFALECEVDGQQCRCLLMGGQRTSDPAELFAVVMDNVDMQGYYEYIAYNIDQIDVTLGTREVYDEVGWTEKWEELTVDIRA